MKIILLITLFFISACTKKYTQYTVIDKRNFDAERPEATNAPPMIRAKYEKEEFCEGQILFNKNAHKITESSVRALVQHSCPGSQYLIDAKITKIWWTALVYSRSCVTLESYCPQKRKK